MFAIARVYLRALKSLSRRFVGEKKFREKFLWKIVVRRSSFVVRRPSSFVVVVVVVDRNDHRRRLLRESSFRR
ncbi:MAG: hypothetical protein K0U52_13175 [Gammaproteobacteria bacterium]|nr:hypothetical protein [Gammaproteobacteria bacterium]